MLNSLTHLFAMYLFLMFSGGSQKRKFEKRYVWLNM